MPNLPRSRPTILVGRGLALATLVALAAIPAIGRADDRDHRGYGGGGYHHNWNGGYYHAPPVVYGSPYGSGYYGAPYYAPPVVYGPGIGVVLPGINLNIH